MVASYGRRSLTRSYEGYSHIEVWLYFEFEGKLFSNFVRFLFQLILSAFFVPRLFSSFCLLRKYTLAHGVLVIEKMTVLGALTPRTVIWELTRPSVKIKTREGNAQRWRIGERAAIQAHVSLAGFLMCSTALSHFPSQNYLITEKIYKQKNSYSITNGRSIRAEKRRI